MFHLWHFYAMAGTAHISIAGEIGYDTVLSDAWNQNSVKDQFEAVNAPDSITLHIDSIGGSCMEGWGIHDYLRTRNLPITAIVEGYCASIATVIFLAADADKRLMNENSYFMIHNPWMQVAGSASEFSSAAAQLIKEEQKLSSFYAKTTGLAEADIAEMMAVETEMSAAEALKFNFISKVISTTAPSATIAARKRQYSQMCAKIKAGKYNKSENMANKVLESLSTGFAAMAAALKGPVMNGSVKCDEGELHFGGGEVGEGDAVYSDPEMTTAAADGDYSKDQTSYSVKDGKISTIAPKEEEDADDSEAEASAKPAADPDADEDPEEGDSGEGDEEAKKAEAATAVMIASIAKEKAGRIKAVKELKAFQANAEVWAKGMNDATALIAELRAELAKDRKEVKAEIKSSFEFVGGSRVTSGKPEEVKKQAFASGLSDEQKAILKRSK